MNKLTSALLLTIGSAGATAFLDSLLNSTSMFSKPALAHAGVAALLVMVACAKQSFLPPSKDGGK